MNGSYREIITQAVCGKAQKTLNYSEYVNPPQGKVPSQILGCSVTELRLNEPEVKAGSNNAVNVVAGGVFEVHIWYAFNNSKDTDVLRYPINFIESLSLENYDCQTTDALDVKIIVDQSPVVVNSAISEDGRIKLAAEMGLSVEVIGETKLLVHLYVDDNCITTGNHGADDDE